MLMTREYYKLMEMFEKEQPGRLDREAKEFWPQGRIYQNGEVNALFLMFQRGYALGKFVGSAD